MFELFCPCCGNKMVFQDKLCGQYRFHDVYYGCEACDKCWEVNDEEEITALKLQNLKLSQCLKLREEQKQRGKKNGD